VYIGHINLAESFNGAGEHFVRLVESLQRRSFQQYVLVRNVGLAKRLDLIDGVTVGPVIRSALTAYCLMPMVDVVHIHDTKSASAGLLFTLTRGVPFVLTRRCELGNGMNPLIAAAQNRAAGFIDENQIGVDDHIEVYRRAEDSLRLPTVLL
jgi:hypothetical protein